MLTPQMSRQSVGRELRDYLMITIAMLSYTIGWTLFLLPNHITTGGVAGVSSLIFWATGLQPQWSYFVINAVLLAFAFRILGLRFCLKTVWAVVVITVAVPVMTKLTGGLHLLADQPFMAAILGAVFCGCGVGLGLSNNGSTGGTDIIAAIINKYRDVSLGHVIMLCDVVIISCSYFVLKDWEKVIYGYVVLYITAFCLDQVVNQMRRSVQFFIISKRHAEIGHRINQMPHRGVTVIDAHGFYTGQEVKMLFVLARKRESQVIFKIIHEIDPAAFVSQSAVIGVYGEGFDHIKAK